MITSLWTAVRQFPAGMDVAASLARLRAGIDGLEAGTLAVAPEGTLSCYLPEPGFVASLDPKTLAQTKVPIANLLPPCNGQPTGPIWREAAKPVARQVEKGKPFAMEGARSFRDSMTISIVASPANTSPFSLRRPRASTASARRVGLSILPR